MDRKEECEIKKREKEIFASFFFPKFDFLWQEYFLYVIFTSERIGNGIKENSSWLGENKIIII